MWVIDTYVWVTDTYVWVTDTYVGEHLWVIDTCVWVLTQIYAWVLHRHIRVSHDSQKTKVMGNSLMSHRNMCVSHRHMCVGVDKDTWMSVTQTHTCESRLPRTQRDGQYPCESCHTCLSLMRVSHHTGEWVVTQASESSHAVSCYTDKHVWVPTQTHMCMWDTDTYVNVRHRHICECKIMSGSACKYVCMHVCMCTYIYIYTYIYVCINIYTRTHICAYTCNTHIHIYLYTYVCI